MKKIISLFLTICLIFVGITLSGCGESDEIILTGGPAYNDKIYGNGGFVVTKGDYVYFTDSYLKIASADNSTLKKYILENVVETGLYRAKMTTEIIADVETPVLKDVQLMVKKSVGFENCGLYIFKDKIYFASPTTDSDKTGIRFDLITFYSCNLDGSNVKEFYQTQKFDGGKFSMTMIDNNIYLLIYDGSSLLIINESGKVNKTINNVTDAILPSRTTVVNNDENPITNDCFIYYTVDKEKIGSLSNGNKLLKVDIKNGLITELYNEDKINITLKSLTSGKLFYVRNELFGSASSYSYYSNSLDGENFLSTEKKHIELGSSSTTNAISLGEYENKNLGIAYINGNSKIIVKNYDNTQGEVFVESATSIIGSRNGYLYYVASSSIYRKSLLETDATAEKLSGSLTIKTDFYDLDDDFFYFFANDTSKSNKIALYRLDLDSSSKTPVKMK